MLGYRKPPRHPRLRQRCACQVRAVADESWCSPIPIEESCHLGSIHEARQERSLVTDNLCTQRCELVITTTRVMRCTWVGGSGLTHELVCYEPRERAIQRSRPQTHSAIGELVHKTHHGVPMALTRSQCKQHLKPRRSQCRGITCRTHTQTIQSSLDMTEMDISDLGTPNQGARRTS